ncbi:DUF7533 family protein [Halalkalicoccus tibetensis]|uniref:Uncharacterized protein n=1 Tax=Halalkalicoccus tibetensis TaxID=175632 RepID=A0ABD5V6N8_9EURY
MKLPGILTMIQMGSGLVFAIPLGLIGFEFLVAGRTVFGATFLFLAAAMLFLPEYVMRRVGGPRDWIRGLLPFRRGD